MKLNLIFGVLASVAYASDFAIEDYTGHVHGAGCNHDHAAEGGDHAHEHGEDCNHDHAAEGGEHAHEHGAGCNHDHAAEGGEHAHEHGEGCNHDHAAEGGEHAHEHGAGCNHDHAAESGEHAHEHGAGCNHDHAAEGGEHAHEHGEGCNHDHAAEGGEHSHEHGEGCTHDHSSGPVVVKADAHARHISAMKIEEVPAAGLALTHSMYGHLFVPRHALESYSLPCGGRISLHVKSAQNVKKGDILYTVVAPEVSSLVADIRKQEAAITRCGEEIESLSQRLSRLKAAGTTNSDIEEQLNFKNAEKRQLQRELEVTQAKLNILVMGAEIKPENGMPTLVVRAHNDGIVRNVGITQGSWGEQGAAVVTMSNLAAMEIEGTLYGNNVPDFTTVRATRLSGRDNTEIEGTWRMAEQVDEEKQTRAFYFIPDALPTDARPGQLCRVDFYNDGGEQGYVTIPDSALVKVGIDDVVFLEVAEGTFAMVKVQAGTSRRGMTPVKGLVPGQRLVVKGGYELRYLLPADGSQQKKAGHFHADGKFHEGEDH